MLPVLLSFALFILYLLLPLVPAVVIYKRFPHTAVTVSGPLSKLTVNASGAFAAYMVVVVLGYGAMTKIHERIEELATPTWEVSAQVEFQKAGKPIPDPHQVIRDMRILVDPPLDQRNYPEVKMRLPLIKPDHWPTLVLHVPGFQLQPIHLSRDEDFERSALRGRRTLKRRVVFEALPAAAVERPYVPTEAALKPLD